MNLDNKKKRRILWILFIIILLTLISILGIIFILKNKDKSSSSSSNKANIIYDNLFAYSDTLIRKDLSTYEEFKSKRIVSLNYINSTMEYGLLSSADDKEVLINFRINNLNDDVFTNIYNNDFATFNNYRLDEYNTFINNSTHFLDYTYKYFLKSELNNDKTYFYGLKYDNKCFYSIANHDIDNNDVNEIKADENQKDYFNLLAYIFTNVSNK